MSIAVKSEEILGDNIDYNSDEGTALEDSGGESYPQNYNSEQQIDGSPHHRIQRFDLVPLTSSGKPSKNMLETEKRMRREIANSNERRRMQSINAGFQSLRSLLPHHEGEKLSKASILQHTAQYIIELEREKTHFLSQNSQLKRLLGQQENGNENGDNAVIKKRKLTDNVMALQTISDSSDEGLGSMSPEPITLISGTTKTNATSYISSSAKEVNELKARLENERKRRTIVEDRLRQIERQIFLPKEQFIQREVIEHTDNLRDETISVSVLNDNLKLEVVEIDSLPTVGHNQVVVCSSPLENCVDENIERHIEDFNDITNEMITDDIQEEVIINEETDEVRLPSRLQPILEAAMNAEPKVEVERINATINKIKDDTVKKDGCKNSRVFLTSTSRQNLETIVEAIRHLEGDHLFGESPEQKNKVGTVVTQNIPTVVTNKSPPPPRKQLTAELCPFLTIKKKNINSNNLTVVSTPNLSKTTTLSTTTTTLSGNNNNSNNKINNLIINSTPISNSNQLIGTISHNSNNTTLLQNIVSNIPTTNNISTITAKQCRPGVIVAKNVS